MADHAQGVRTHFCDLLIVPCLYMISSKLTCDSLLCVFKCVVLSGKTHQHAILHHYTEVCAPLSCQPSPSVRQRLSLKSFNHPSTAITNIYSPVCSLYPPCDPMKLTLIKILKEGQAIQNGLSGDNLFSIVQNG